MTRRLLIECGAAQTRAAFLVGDEPMHFWFGPARGDENLPAPPQAGDLFAGRVRSVSKPLGGAFIDIGAERDGFLPFRKNEKPLSEGAQIIVMARRPPIDGKGAVLRIAADEDLHDGLIEQARKFGVGELGRSNDAAVMAFCVCGLDRGGDFEILVGEPASKRALEDWSNDTHAKIEPELFERYLIDEAIEEMFGQRITLENGAELIFHETEAGVLIDIDSAAAAGRALLAINDKINESAARRMFLEIQRRQIGGRVIVDFVPPANAATRTRLADSVKAGLKSFARSRFGKLSADGFCDFTLARTSRSHLEHATESAGAGWPVPGRRFTRDWLAKAAIRKLERALGARASARLRLIVGPEIADYLEGERPQWAERLKQKFGARFSIERSALMEPRDHDLAE